MKFCTALSISQLLVIVSVTSVMSQTRSLFGQDRGLRKMLGNARRLDQGDDNNDQDVDEADMEAFLVDYSLKFMKCVPDQVFTDADYNDHFGVVIFRLCPSNQCSDTSGCSSGYAEFAVDIGTYVDAYLEDQADNMNWDDNFDGGDFGQCTEYEAQDENGNGDDVVYYVGPGCTEDGTSLKMAVYGDQYCYQESETSFDSISNGWSLPYSSGGLVSTQCIGCTDDVGDIREICVDLYEDSPYRCEAEFDFKHYYYDTNFEMYRYGQDTTGCTKINVLGRPRSEFSSEAVWTDAILAVMLLVVTAAGYAYYSSWWKKQKENLEKIEDDEDYQLEDDDDDGDYVSGEENVVNDSMNDSALNESADSNLEGKEFT